MRLVEIKDYEKLKKDIDNYNNKVARLEATKEVILKEVKSILSEYGIDDIKDYKKLFELLESEKPKVLAYMAEKTEELEQQQSKLVEVENIIAN